MELSTINRTAKATTQIFQLTDIKLSDLNNILTVHVSNDLNGSNLILEDTFLGASTIDLIDDLLQIQAGDTKPGLVKASGNLGNTERDALQKMLQEG